MIDDRKQIVVGLFVLGGIILLGVLIIWFEGVAGFVRERYEVQGHLPSSMGVRAGKRVHKDGIEVGEVVGVTSSLPERPGVWVHMRINEDVDIPIEAEFVAQQSTVGDVFLDFQTTHVPTGHLPKDGSARIEGLVKPPSFLPEDVLEEVRDGIATLKRLGPLSESLTELVEPRTLEEVEAGQPANLSSAVKQFQVTAKTLQDQIEDPESPGGRLLAAATKSAEELSETLTDARVTLASIRETVAVYKETGTKASDLVNKATTVADQLKTDAEEAQKLIGNLSGLVDDVRQGKGSMGRLVADDEFYRTLTNLLEDLSALSKNMDRLITMWREEGILAKEGKRPETPGP